MRVVVVLPDSPYYLWQALVQAVHLEEQGFTDVHHLVHHQRRTPSPMLQKMADGVPSVQPVEVTDAQWAEHYPPALKPLTLSRWMRADPAREDVPFFYIDPDAVFTRYPERMPDIWNGSDTDWYTGPDYIRSKGEGLWEAMCGLAEVDPEVARVDRGAGAQWVIGDTCADFWEHVAEVAVDIHDLCVATADRYWPDGHEHPVQAWCAEMYATQLCAIADGHAVVVNPHMNFTWANGKDAEWDDPDTMFFHSAGVPKHNGVDFAKSAFRVFAPFRARPHVHTDSASSRYVDVIERTRSRYPKLTGAFQ